MDRRAQLVAGLLAAACGGTHAAQAGVNDFAGFMQRVTGANAVTVGVGGSGTLVVTQPSAQLGGTSGWTTARNFGSGSTSAGIRLGMVGDASVAGVRVPVTVATSVGKSALADGMGILFRNAAKFAGPIGVVAMLADFASVLQAAGIRPNPAAEIQPDKPFLGTGRLVTWTVWDIGNVVSSGPSLELACAGMVGKVVPPSAHGNTNQGNWTVTSAGVAGGECSLNYKTDLGGSVQRVSWKDVQERDIEGLPANWEAVRPKFEAMNPMPSDVLSRQLEWARQQAGRNGIEPYKITTDASTVTAPSTLPTTTETDVKTRIEDTPAGPKKITTTTTKTKTTEVETTGDKLKVTPKETTTTRTKTEHPDGTVTETTETETKETESDSDPKNEPQTPDLCEKNPDIVACQKLGDLQAEPLKNENRQLEITPDTGWDQGSAQCPGPRTAVVAGVTLSMPFTMLCNFAVAIKPLLLGFAWLSAALTFFGFSRRD